jgi:predicted nucleic acid-binding protein
MSDRAFLDTNVLVYAYDRRDPVKQARAQALLTEGIQEETLVLSVQVLGEFFNVVTRHIPRPLTIGEARSVIEAVGMLPVQEIDCAMVSRAIETHETYRVGYWDALIISAAERSGCTAILTEDLSDGQAYHDIVVRNPFAQRCFRS